LVSPIRKRSAIACLTYNSLDAYQAFIFADLQDRPYPVNNDLFLVVALAVLIAFMFMNSRKRKKQAQELQSSVKIGATVMLHSGVIGKVVSVDGDRIVIESTPGTKLTVVKAAVRNIEASASASAPTAKSASAPATKPAAKPAAKSAAKPAAKKTTKPAAKKPASK
jgi:preprotein translocase subunit YajC